MWELYAFWTLVPFLVAGILNGSGGPSAVPLASFAIIASGGIGCVAAGYLAAAASRSRSYRSGSPRLPFPPSGTRLRGR
jgi:hypothetical protein